MMKVVEYQLLEDSEIFFHKKTLQNAMLGHDETLQNAMSGLQNATPLQSRELELQSHRASIASIASEHDTLIERELNYLPNRDRVFMIWSHWAVSDDNRKMKMRCSSAERLYKSTEVFDDDARVTFVRDDLLAERVEAEVIRLDTNAKKAIAAHFIRGARLPAEARHRIAKMRLTDYVRALRAGRMTVLARMGDAV